MIVANTENQLKLHDNFVFKMLQITQMEKARGHSCSV